MNSFLPSLLGSGEERLNGLDVSANGAGSERKRPELAAAAQICPCDWKMKYFPSAVHLPQHSSGGLCSPTKSGRSPVPSMATSRSICCPMVPAVSEESNRKRRLSGDQVRLLMSPVMLTILCGSVPSAFATNRSPRFE